LLKGICKASTSIERLGRLDNNSLRLVQTLESMRPLFRGLSAAYEGIRRYSDRFQYPVIGPLISEIKVSDPKIAQYLENQVPMATWTLFIVHSDDDMRTLQSLNLMQEINVINVGPPEHNNRQVTPAFGSNLQR